MILKNSFSPSWFSPILSSYISLSSFFLSILFILQYPLLIYGGGNGSSTSSSKEWNCQHHNVQELIKTSPVILKALGANIFADDVLAIQQKKQLQIINNNNKKDKDEKKYFYLKENYYTQKQNKRKSSSRYYDRIDYDDDLIDFNNDKKSWITLTPETIYKGASLLKVARTQQTSTDNIDISSGDNVAGRILDESYRYEGQLNATLEPIGCFDKDILNLLPTELIIFGKLISNSNDQQQQHLQDVLKISINGFHRWSPQFENQIWKYLGWDDWSDFTLCSVTCGKGVQQRFRRCLLDSPSTTTPLPTSQLSFDDDLIDTNQQQNNQRHFNVPTLHEHFSYQEIIDVAKDDSQDDNDDVDVDVNGIYIYNKHHHHNRYRSVRVRIDDDDRNDDNNKNSKSLKHKKFTTSKSGMIKKGKQKHSKTIKSQQQQQQQQQKQRWKKKRKTKGLTTLSCEGYNIEQRNCNMFECGDDISDLLKFYKRMTIQVNETMLSLGTTISTSAATTLMMSSQSTRTKENTLTDSNTLGTTSTTTATATTSTRSQGFLHGWRFFTNFTLMITLRVKIPPTQSTIFSIRNLTHNLYLDQSENGLKFFQERDEVTEMLPIKFDLYDNRWHQIAISVQNGDFITVYVDCLWTNSFVVSKRLFALPDGADIEIGREFNGELQQLSILPENQEKLQCSTIRTSINEVKRYIIDTFIDDYGN